MENVSPARYSLPRLLHALGEKAKPLQASSRLLKQKNIIMFPIHRTKTSLHCRAKQQQLFQLNVSRLIDFFGSMFSKMNNLFFVLLTQSLGKYSKRSYPNDVSKANKHMFVIYKCVVQLRKSRRTEEIVAIEIYSSRTTTVWCCFLFNLKRQLVKHYFRFS